MTKTMALATVSKSSEGTLKFIEMVSDSLMFGNMTPPERKSAAVICATQMISEGLTFAELRTRYHIYPDRLEQRAEYVHAAIERAGWKWTWKEDGEDGSRATFAAIKNGQTKEVSFSIEQAKKKGLIRPGSAWDTDPALMLRARCITRFATMWVPQVGAGVQDDGDASGLIRDDEEPSQIKTAYVEPALAPEEAVVQKVEEAVAENQINLDTPLVALAFPRRAMTSFAKQPTISHLRGLCALTYEELLDREGMGAGTADKVVEILKEHGMSLAAEEGEEEIPDVQAHKEDDDEPPTNSAHGEALAEIRQLCSSDESLKRQAIEKIDDLWPDKKSLHDLDSLETHLLLVYIYAIKAGFADKFDSVANVICADPHPIDRAKSNITQLKDRIKN